MIFYLTKLSTKLLLVILTVSGVSHSEIQWGSPEWKLVNGTLNEAAHTVLSSFEGKVSLKYTLELPIKGGTKKGEHIVVYYHFDKGKYRIEMYGKVKKGDDFDVRQIPELIFCFDGERMYFYEKSSEVLRLASAENVANVHPGSHFSYLYFLVPDESYETSVELGRITETVKEGTIHRATWKNGNEEVTERYGDLGVESLKLPKRITTKINKKLASVSTLSIVENDNEIEYKLPFTIANYLIDSDVSEKRVKIK